jgi:hypothetical protein
MRVRNKYLTIVAAAWGPFFALTAAFCFFVIKPQIDCTRKLAAELNTTRTLYFQAQEAAKTETQTRMAQTVEKVQARVADFVIPLTAAPDLAFEISQLANEAGVESFAMRPRNRGGIDPPATVDRLLEKHIDLSFASPFQHFLALVNALERHRPSLFIETFTISHSQAQSSEPQVNMELAALIEKPQGS